MTDLGPSFDALHKWVSQQWRGGGAPLHAGAEPRLMPTCFAVLAMECAGGLDGVDTTQKQQTIDAILAKQSPNTGYFQDGELRTRELSSHRPEYVVMQHTYFALHALSALGAEPRYRLSAADRFRSLDYLRGWLDGGPWQDPWLHSNNVMFTLTFLQHEHQRDGGPWRMDAFDAVLDYLDERQDPESGMWQREGGRDDRNAVFAAYHFYPYYFWRGRRPAFVDETIDTTLGTQTAEGFFLPGGGGACEDLDAVHTLVMMALVSDHRAADIRKSLDRCARAILDSQRPDGGFANYRQDCRRFAKRLIYQTGIDRKLLGRDLVPREWRYSGWKQLSCPLGVSDMWSAWFRPLSLRVIADLYPDGYSGTPTEPYRTMPGLGWHVTKQIADSGPAAVGVSS